MAHVQKENYGFISALTLNSEFILCPCISVYYRVYLKDYLSLLIFVELKGNMYALDTSGYDEN